MSLLDPKWNYTHSTATDIRNTFARHGFKPTTAQERDAQQARAHYVNAITGIDEKACAKLNDAMRSGA